MKYGILGAVAAVALLVSSGAQALTIDPFDTTQTLSGATPGFPASGAVTGTMLGGEREITLTQVAGSGTVVSINPVAAPGELVIDNAAGNSITAILYDGVGSGGFAATDFTEGSTQNAIQLLVNFADFPIALEIIATSAGGTSSITNPGLTGVSTPTPLDLEYASFTTDSGSGADFTAITAIEFIFTTSFGIEDMRIEIVGTTDTNPPIVVPEPAGLAFLGLGLIGLGVYRRRRKANLTSVQSL